MKSKRTWRILFALFTLMGMLQLAQADEGSSEGGGASDCPGGTSEAGGPCNNDECTGSAPSANGDDPNDVSTEYAHGSTITGTASATTDGCCEEGEGGSYEVSQGETTTVTLNGDAGEHNNESYSVWCTTATFSYTVVKIVSIAPEGKTYAYMHQPKKFKVTTDPADHYSNVTIDPGEGMITSALNSEGIVEISWDKDPSATAFSDTVKATFDTTEQTVDITVYDWYKESEDTPGLDDFGTTVSENTETDCPWYEWPLCIRWGETTSAASVSGSGASTGITLGGKVHTWSNGISSPQTNNAIEPHGKTQHTITYKWNGPESTLPSNNEYTVKFSGSGSGSVKAQGRYDSQDGGCLVYARGQISMSGATSGPDESINGQFSYADADANFHNFSTTVTNAGITFSYENSDEKGAKYAVGGSVSTTTTPNNSQYPEFTHQSGFSVPANNYEREFTTGPTAEWDASMDLQANCNARSVGNTGAIQPVWQSNEANVDINSLKAKFDISMQNEPRAAVSPDEES